MGFPRTSLLLLPEEDRNCAVFELIGGSGAGFMNVESVDPFAAAVVALDLD